jgi:hypothetical protein
MGDPSQVGPLLDQIQDIEQVTADGAYDGAPTYQTVAQHGARRCCTENFKSEVWALSPGSCGFFGGTDGIRATDPKHAIQNRDADGGFGLLTCKGPCPKLRANNPFVSAHSGFRERAAAIAGRLLPFQSPFGLDQGDMAITL